MNRHFRDNLIFILVSSAAFLAEPAIVYGQANPYNPVNFTEPLSLYRGKISPASQDALYLDETDICRLLTEEWGWESCDGVEAMIIDHAPGVDTLMVESPNSEGYVKFDDWDDADRQTEIDAIWKDFVEGSKAQGKAVGQEIVPVKWLVYPTLNREKSYLYYAILINWNGEPVVNVKASLFDRKGYIPFRLIPLDSNISTAELEQLVEVSLGSYEAESQQAYFNFESGDKVAAVGALGVLAALVGVKYGKAAGAGIIAFLLLILKKAWFVLLLPLIFLKNLLFGRKSE